MFKNLKGKLDVKKEVQSSPQNELIDPNTQEVSTTSSKNASVTDVIASSPSIFMPSTPSPTLVFASDNASSDVLEKEKYIENEKVFSLENDFTSPRRCIDLSPEDPQTGDMKTGIDLLGELDPLSNGDADAKRGTDFESCKPPTLAKEIVNTKPSCDLSLSSSLYNQAEDSSHGVNDFSEAPPQSSELDLNQINVMQDDMSDFTKIVKQHAGDFVQLESTEEALSTPPPAESLDISGSESINGDIFESKNQIDDFAEENSNGKDCDVSPALSPIDSDKNEFVAKHEESQNKSAVLGLAGTGNENNENAKYNTINEMNVMSESIIGFNNSNLDNEEKHGVKDNSSHEHSSTLGDEIHNNLSHSNNKKIEKEDKIDMIDVENNNEDKVTHNNFPNTALISKGELVNNNENDNEHGTLIDNIPNGAYDNTINIDEKADGDKEDEVADDFENPFPEVDTEEPAMHLDIDPLADENFINKDTSSEHSQESVDEKFNNCEKTEESTTEEEKNNPILKEQPHKEQHKEQQKQQPVKHHNQHHKQQHHKKEEEVKDSTSPFSSWLNPSINKTFSKESNASPVASPSTSPIPSRQTSNRKEDVAKTKTSSPARSRNNSRNPAMEHVEGDEPSVIASWRNASTSLGSYWTQLKHAAVTEVEKSIVTAPSTTAATTMATTTPSTTTSKREEVSSPQPKPKNYENATREQLIKVLQKRDAQLRSEHRKALEFENQNKEFLEKTREITQQNEKLEKQFTAQQDNAANRMKELKNELNLQIAAKNDFSQMLIETEKELREANERKATPGELEEITTLMKIAKDEEEEKERLSELVASLRSKLKQQSTKVDDLKTVNTNLVKESSSYHDKWKAAEIKLENSLKEHKESQRIAQETESQLKTVHQEYEKLTKSRIIELEKNLKKVQGLYSDVSLTKDALEEQKKSTLLQLHTTQSQYDDCAKELENSKQVRLALERQTKNLEERKASWEERYERSATQNRNTEEKLGILQKEHETMGTELEIVKREKSQLCLELVEARNESDDIKQQFQSCRKQESENSDKFTNLIQENEAQNKKISELEKQNNDLITDLEEKTNLINEIEADHAQAIKTLNKKISDLKRTLSKAIRGNASTVNPSSPESFSNHDPYQNQPLRPSQSNESISSFNDVPITMSSSSKKKMSTSSQRLDNHIEHPVDLNVGYLHYVVYKYMTSPDAERKHLINVISTMLGFSSTETNEAKKFVNKGFFG